MHIDGGYREFIAVPESDCYVLPDSLSDTDAIMIEPTTIGIQSCTRAQLEKDDMLLIYGSGALGSTILKVARLLCDHIIVADIMDDKLELARQNGAKYTINPLKEDLTEKIKEYTEGHGSTVSIDSACTKDSSLLFKGNWKCRKSNYHGLFSSSYRGKSVPDHLQGTGGPRFQTSESYVRQSN